ncbi:RNA 2',3'-cyclic phosphodiesterase [Oceanobacillus kapialis]|uniref:RNA 2',3'-cyclic phosphodiesterase n=1 Tax=Oceanobacillus kapialis TaxID=481353 RepID=A0ABW5Q4Q3_9BACI
MGNHYFIAIPIPEKLKERLSQEQDSFKKHLPYKQWPFPEDFHITLKFYGDLPDNKVQLLKESILTAVHKLPSFSIKVKGIGYFGNPSKPRVLWAGVEKTEPLVNLYSAVEDASTSCGIAKENRPYRPHITVAKNWRGEANKGKLDSIIQPYNDIETITVERVVLYQIFPQQRPKYKQVASFSLEGDGDTGTID